MDKTSRREFLGMSALGLAAALAPKKLVLQINPTMSSSSGEPHPGSEVSIWETSDEGKFAAKPKVRWLPASEGPEGEQIRLDPNTRFQKLLGFGAALTDAACYTLNRLQGPSRDQLFQELFHPSQLGLSVCRICVGSSDYSTKLYSFDEGEPDPELTRFSIDHDREYILPVLKQARKVNPDLFLFSSPWSPPGWMKFNNSMLGGSMRNHYFSAYANYYMKFLQAYAAEGVPVQALTTQNEVDTDQDGRMPACIWPQEYEIHFVRDHLGPLLATSGMATKIWILDHNYDLWGRAACMLQDEKLRKYVDAVAWHGYSGTPDMMSRVHDLFPQTEMHWTEGGPDYTDPHYLTDWCKWSATFTAVLRNWCTSITAWNLALDERGKPNIGPFSCGGVVTINSANNEVSRSGQYWAFAQYSRLIRRGAQRFESQSTSPNLEHVGFENPDGQKILVLTNAGQERRVNIRLSNQSAPITLASNSVNTVVWN